MYSITVVTICFNNLDDLKQTCASVDAQNRQPFEHLIIDGSSKPDIKTYLETGAQPPYRRWICERDKGISDAFNKGIENARGDIIYLLNSGDRMYDATVLQRAASVFDADPSVMWCHGKLHLLRGGLWVDIGKPFERSKLYRGMRGTLHPTMYLRKELYEKHGRYDLSYRYAMDYDLLCRIADEKFTFIDYPMAIFDPTGRSTTDYLKAMEDAFSAYRKYFGPSVQQKLWGWRLTTLHYLLESKMGKLLYKLKVKMGKENA